MIRHILVPASGMAGDDGAFMTALAAARQDAAHLQFLHVRPDITAIVAAMADGGFSSGSFLQSTIDQMEADAQAQEATTRQAVATFCAQARVDLDAGATPGVKISAEFTVETGDAGRTVAKNGRFADLVVARRPVGEQFATGIMETVLMTTGRPLLIAGKATPPVLSGVAMIAWKDRPEAARAVAAAMPFIEQAKRVMIVCVEEEGAAPQASCERLLRSVRWHNPAIDIERVQRSDRPAAEVMLDMGTRLGAKLLIMGGYSHNRIREIIFGGFTRHVLERADPDFPVLMAH